MRLKQMCEAADRVIGKGHNVLILSDRGVDRENAAIPALAGRIRPASSFDS